MSNWGDIPLAVVENITSSPPFSDGDGSLGVAYISVFMIMLNLTFFPLGGHKLIAHDFRDVETEKIVYNIELQEQNSEPGVNVSDQLQRNKSRVTKFLASLLTPVNISILAGLLLGLTPAKRLFVKGEDNPFLVSGLNPPLHIVYLTAKFLGAACVPVGLLNIGAAIVGLDMKSVPLGLNVALAFFKLIVLPLIGIPLVYWCTHGLNLIGKEERSLQLVLMFASCVPSATTTLVLTQYFNPTGEAKHLTAIFVVQYALGLFTMTLALGVISFLIS